jgi:hypothetical protein
MTDNKAKDTTTQDTALRQGGPDAYSGFVANDADGDSSIGHPGAGNSQSGINSNFAKASPESNVGPAGAAQASHGNATGDVPGGTRGKAPSEQNSQSATGGSGTDSAPGNTVTSGAAAPTPTPDRQD